MPLKAPRPLSERRGRVHWAGCLLPSLTNIVPSIHIHKRLFSASWVALQWENICTGFVRVWFIRTPCSLPSPSSSSSPLGLGGFVVFVFKQACVSWDWVTLIYYALDSLTKDSGTGHLFSECRFPVLLQPCSAGAEWCTDVLATLSPREDGLEQRGQKMSLFLRAFLFNLAISFRVPFCSSFFFSFLNKWDKVSQVSYGVAFLKM